MFKESPWCMALTIFLFKIRRRTISQRYNKFDIPHSPPNYLQSYNDN